jgi:hypothetical protein
MTAFLGSYEHPTSAFRVSRPQSGCHGLNVAARKSDLVGVLLSDQFIPTNR